MTVNPCCVIIFLIRSNNVQFSNVLYQYYATILSNSKMRKVRHLFLLLAGSSCSSITTFHIISCHRFLATKNRSRSCWCMCTFYPPPVPPGCTHLPPPLLISGKVKSSEEDFLSMPNKEKRTSAVAEFPVDAGNTSRVLRHHTAGSSIMLVTSIRSDQVQLVHSHGQLNKQRGGSFNCTNERPQSRQH